jgi:hypothetical protein
VGTAGVGRILGWTVAQVGRGMAPVSCRQETPRLLHRQEGRKRAGPCADALRKPRSRDRNVGRRPSRSSRRGSCRALPLPGQPAATQQPSCPSRAAPSRRAEHDRTWRTDATPSADRRANYSRPTLDGRIFLPRGRQVENGLLLTPRPADRILYSPSREGPHTEDEDAGAVRSRFRSEEYVDSDRPLGAMPSPHIFGSARRTDPLTAPRL